MLKLFSRKVPMVAFLVCALPLHSFASDQVGTLTQVEGEVKVFTNPSKTIQKSENSTASHALYEGEYYTVHDAKIGDKVEQGNILRTALGAKVRVVFDNGDQFNVGPGTAYRVFWGKTVPNSGTQVNLMYGKLRGIIEKGGPRSHLQVKTKTAVMGVRGTDFFIATSGADNSTEVAILRGKVEVKPEGPKAKAVEVSAGMSADVAAAPTQQTTTHVVPKVELRKTTQEDFAGIQKSSTVTAQATETSTENTRSEVKKLEEKAVQTTLKDIKAADPKLYAELEKTPVKSMDEINTKAVETLAMTAPKAPPSRKPYKSELDDLEAGAYNKYFKSVE